MKTLDAYLGAVPAAGVENDARGWAGAGDGGGVGCHGYGG